jgi:NADH-quinone oxidoreductase subunit L
METNLLTGVVFAPLVGAAIIGLFGRKMGEKAIGAIACAAVGLSFAFALAAFLQLTSHPAHGEEVRRLNDYVYQWIVVGNFSAGFDFTLDPLSGVYILFVTFVAFWIHVFATGYMKGEEGYWRFFAYLNLFMFNMLVLVLADNLLLMFVGWEGVGLCSYLLIGFYFKKGFANSAAKKAFVVNRIGDVAFALAIMLVFQLSGTIKFADVAAWASLQPVEALSWGAFTASGLTTIAILMFIGATGKSAQIPLFVWLPDAMAGPTPVSALIHAATMVTAGVYMVARTSEIFVHAPAAMLVVAVIGAATALLAATIGLAQWDIKKVLAYSTVSQLGYMFLACGVGAFSAGVFHVVTHAFFKALLFLGSGSVIIGMHHEQDMDKMGGLRKYMPITHATMAVGWLAICGFPLLSGFFSKDEILFQTFATQAFGHALGGQVGMVLWGVGAVTAILTAIYMTRLMALTFWTPERFGKDTHQKHAHGAADDEHAHHGLKPGEHPHETGPSMTVPLMVLAVLAAVGGYLGVPNGLGHLVGWENSNTFEHFLEPVIAKLPVAAEGAAHAAHPASLELGLTVVSVLLALGGIAVGYMVFAKKPLMKLPKILEDKWRVDEIYEALIIKPIYFISVYGLWKFFDVIIIDGIVNGVGRLVRGSGSVLRTMQTGLVRSYVALILVGAAIVIVYFTFYERIALYLAR